MRLDGIDGRRDAECRCVCNVRILFCACALVGADLPAIARSNYDGTGAASEFDRVASRPDGMQELLSMGWALKMNNLKIAASEAAPRLVHQALQIIGVLGYRNDSPFSVGRHYRDALSASLMISNERLAAKNASMLLVVKDQ